ncbi:MAG: hypothetical protein OEV52_01125 [Dehalococcoidia bacterium]|nr:hypothetical protein [Dehalococcoidia bacterium]
MSEASNSSASAATTITMYAVDDEYPSQPVWIEGKRKAMTNQKHRRFQQLQEVRNGYYVPSVQRKGSRGLS